MTAHLRSNGNGGTFKTGSWIVAIWGGSIELKMAMLFRMDFIFLFTLHGPSKISNDDDAKWRARPFEGLARYA